MTGLAPIGSPRPPTCGGNFSPANRGRFQPPPAIPVVQNTNQTDGIETTGTGRPAPSAEFVQLFTQTQRRLYLCILAQVPSVSDSEEILQNTNLVIWSKCNRFTLGTSFFAWASQIATYEVLKHRQRFSRDKLQFNDDFVQAVAGEVEEYSHDLELRRQALESCLKRLRPTDRELIHQRYQPGESGKHLAENLERPANSVYQSLGRIRRQLLDCINRRLSVEAVS